MPDCVIINMMLSPEKICHTCNKSFISHKHTKMLREKAKFCSPQCYWASNQLKNTFSGENSPTWKGGSLTLTCKTCGNSFQVDRDRTDAKTCSKECNKLYRKTEEFRLHLSEVQRSKISDELKQLSQTLRKFSHLLRKSAKYNLWRERIFKRDNFTCQLCEKRGGKLQADHIKPYVLIIQENGIETYEQALACSELWSLDNGRTLCRPCHYKTPTFGSKVLGLLSASGKTLL